MSGFFERFAEREGVARLETAQLSVFGFPCLKTTPLFDFIVAHEGHRNELRGLEFGSEAKDSGLVTIILNSCECNPANVPKVDN